MDDSHRYRVELKQFAKSFEARRKRQMWREDSMSLAERDLFIGFLYVRKFIECRKVTDACLRSTMNVRRARIDRHYEVSAFAPYELEKDLGCVEFVDAKSDVHQVADKVIHAWWIVPVQGESGGLDGYILTTDRHRNSGLWLLSTDQVAKVFRRFSASQVRLLRKARDKNGRLVHWEAM